MDGIKPTRYPQLVPRSFGSRAAVERELQRLAHPTGMQLNDGKERVVLPGGTLALMLRLIDTLHTDHLRALEHRE